MAGQHPEAGFEGEAGLEGDFSDMAGEVADDVGRVAYLPTAAHWRAEIPVVDLTDITLDPIAVALEDRADRVLGFVALPPLGRRSEHGPG